MRWKTSAVGVGVALVLLVALAGAVVAAGPSVLADLVQAKVKAAEAAYKAAAGDYQNGRSDAEKVYLWSRRLAEAQQELSGKKADQVAAVEAHGQRMKGLGKMAEQRYRTGIAPRSEVLGAEFYNAEAALWLARAKAQ
jgi:outer membrane protein TolC